METLEKGRLWTDIEIGRLKEMYVTGSGFEEILKAFPQRSQNAIRQKASRLGLKRPVVKSKLIDAQSLIRCRENGNDNVYLFKCAECGGWIKVNMNNGGETYNIQCPSCSSVCKYII